MSGTEENPAVPAVDASSEEVFRRVRQLQLLTIIWMSLEAVVSLVSAWNSRSPALLAFGGDSFIELLSAIVVLRRFRFRLEEARAARLAGMLLFVLGGLVVVASALNFLGYGEARPSLTGIAILLVAAFLMPWLANRKRKLSAIISSAALRADAAESALCGYMAWIALAGLLTNFLWRKSWADPLAALALIPLIVREGWEAISSAKRDCDCLGPNVNG
jgi:divalent metal cation (Fe/Co/Zn/Cd) transporter